MKKDGAKFGGMDGKHYLCDVNIVRWREGNTHRNNELNLQLATESLLIIVLMETITGSNPVLTTNKIKVMRSKVFQRILHDMDKDPWWVKLKRWFVVEYYVIKCLGLIKYFKNIK